ncbi:hypothetical protein LEP1GSC074_2038 [Leptospira noguchii str. Hook]|nr:hypothetical protein LEP1GSC074_2038 [Leptospira noguchii str. Hook]
MAHDLSNAFVKSVLLSSFRSNSFGIFQTQCCSPWIAA